MDFLDISLNVSDKSHRPYKKPNDTPLYVNTMSNHPKSILLNNIPDMVSKRLSNLSSDKTSFLDTKQVYESALKHSGHPRQVLPKAPPPLQAHQQKHGEIKLLLYAQHWPAANRHTNQKVLKQHQGDPDDLNSATCNCRNKLLRLPIVHLPGKQMI